MHLSKQSSSIQLTAHHLIKFSVNAPHNTTWDDGLSKGMDGAREGRKEIMCIVLKANKRKEKRNDLSEQKKNIYLKKMYIKPLAIKSNNNKEMTLTEVEVKNYNSKVSIHLLLHDS